MQQRNAAPDVRFPGPERIAAIRLESRLLALEFWVMRKSGWTPSIVPESRDRTVYIVADDLGQTRRIWAEADFEATDLEAVIQDLLTGQYRNPLRVIGFNTAPGLS